MPLTKVKRLEGLRISSVVNRLLSMCMVLGSIPNITEKEKGKDEEREGRQTVRQYFVGMII